MRRAVVRPGEHLGCRFQALQRTVDLAKIMACLAISDLQDPDDAMRPVTVKDVAAALALEHSTSQSTLNDPVIPTTATRPRAAPCLEHSTFRAARPIS